jgi:hypothetical protein
LPHGQYRVSQNAYLWWFDPLEADTKVKPRLPPEVLAKLKSTSKPTIKRLHLRDKKKIITKAKLR